jgi:hypothetical protein
MGVRYEVETIFVVIAIVLCSGVIAYPQFNSAPSSTASLFSLEEKFN